MGDRTFIAVDDRRLLASEVDGMLEGEGELDDDVLDLLWEVAQAEEDFIHNLLLRSCMCIWKVGKDGQTSDRCKMKVTSQVSESDSLQIAPLW